MGREKGEGEGEGEREREREEKGSEIYNATCFDAKERREGES